MTVVQLEAELMERQRMSLAELDQLKRNMDTKLTMVTMVTLIPSVLCINWTFNLFYQELSKASQAAEREQEKLVKSKTAAIQQVL